MDANQIKNMGRRLRKFLGEFDDCFVRSNSRQHLRTYVAGQISNLPRKSIEPIALAAKVRPRTLQFFLSSAPWDGPRLRDRTQWLVARDHSHPQAIGIVDETGNPKKGCHTAAVQRQWCGNTGKVDNCVVAVHLAYVTGDFQCLLDSEVFLEKPPAHFWASAAMVKLFGRSTWAVRVPSALAAIGGVAMVFLLARRMAFSVPAAFACGLVMATSGGY